MATLRFLGATKTVTGSKFVLEAGGKRVMVDCGLFQGLKELRRRNWDPFPVDPRAIDALVLTHAHVDHTGYLPRLVAKGFARKVYGSRATVDLCRILLPDSAKLQEEDAKRANRGGWSKHAPALPLYTVREARAALKLLEGKPYRAPTKLPGGMELRLFPSGHILGSGFAEITAPAPSGGGVKVLFSGDIGRFDEPILVDPTPVEEADYLLVEATYGDRLHGAGDPRDRLAAVIRETAARGGSVVIPAFAVGRTQHLLYLIAGLEREGKIPVLPVVVDSPMAAEATVNYISHVEEHDAEMKALAGAGRDPLRTRRFMLSRTAADSQAALRRREPSVIISASGMATGGRVLNHLRERLPDERTTVLFVGYQAEGTRGRRLQDGEKELKIQGAWVPVKARIETIGSLSAHADYGEIMRWLGGFTRPPRRTFVVHGEAAACEALAARIGALPGWNASIPEYGEAVELT